MTPTQRTINAIIGDLEIIATRMPAYREAQALLAPSPLKATRTDTQPGSQGGHADPTLNHIIATLDQDNEPEDIDTQLNATRYQTRWIRDQQDRTINATQHRPRTDREQRDHERTMRDLECRCTQPNCGENWAIDPNNSTRWAGYSQRCMERERKAAQRQTGTTLANVPPNGVEPATFEQRAPVEPTLPIDTRFSAYMTCPCGWQTYGANDNETELHAQLRTELEQHQAETHHG